jgi:anaerobic selenocysteine-containing dehydrogenase
MDRNAPRPTRAGARSTTLHHQACTLCEAICGLVIEVEDGRIASIRGDRDDPLSRGHICPKAVALQDIHNDPDRLRHPVRRTRGGGWQRVPWKAALDEAADRLRAVQDADGRDAVAVYIGNPAVHSLGMMLFGPPLWRTLRTRNRFSATSVDQLPHHLAAMLMFGHQLLLPVPDVDRTSFLLVLGANPAVSNGSMMTAPGMKRRLRALGERGGRLVVVDPRRTETARLADRHLFIRPGTDALLLAALLQVLFTESLAAPGPLADHISGMEVVRELVAGFPPERVAAATGIEATAIRELARELAAAPAGVCYGRLGVSVHEFGGLCQWLINVLNTVTGNLDRPGGAMFTRPAVDLLSRIGRGRYNRWQSRVRGLPEFSGELPAATMAEEMLSPEPGRPRALVTVAGNPVLSTPNGGQLERALAQLDCMVSVDLYVNETTCHADLILPPTSPLERDHYDLVFNMLAVRNTARYSRALFAPEAGALHDWQILAELQRRLDRGPLHSRAGRLIARTLGPRRLLDLGLRTGPYGAGFTPWARGLTAARLARSAHGVDLGPLQPCLPDALRTPTGRIELAPELFVEDMMRLEERSVELQAIAAADDALVLIGRRQLRSNNSWMHNVPRLVTGRERCTLLVHPEDATRLGVAAGERVAVASRVGRIVAPVEITDDIMPGVVSLPHGWGHDREGVQLTVARQHPGASLNDLTDDQAVDPVAGTAVLNGTPVRVIPETPRE